MGKPVWVRLDGELLPLTIAGTAGESGMTWAVLRTERFPRAWLDQRRLEIYLVLERHTGVLVPARYLRRRGGAPGLIIMTRGRKEFAAVRILGRDRDQAVVQGVAEGTVLLPR